MRHAKELTKKSRRHQVYTTTDATTFDVTSGSSGKVYKVRSLADGRFWCGCKWHEYHSAGECSHVIAVREWLANTEGRHTHAHASKAEARQSHHRLDDRNDGLWFTSRKAKAG